MRVARLPKTYKSHWKTRKTHKVTTHGSSTRLPTSRRTDANRNHGRNDHPKETTGRHPKNQNHALKSQDQNTEHQRHGSCNSNMAWGGRRARSGRLGLGAGLFAVTAAGGARGGCVAGGWGRGVAGRQARGRVAGREGRGRRVRGRRRLGLLRRVARLGRVVVGLTATATATAAVEGRSAAAGGVDGSLGGLGVVAVAGAGTRGGANLRGLGSTIAAADGVAGWGRRGNFRGVRNVTVAAANAAASRGRRRNFTTTVAATDAATAGGRRKLRGVIMRGFAAGRGGGGAGAAIARIRRDDGAAVVCG